MQYAVEAVEIRPREVAEVLAYFRNLGSSIAEIATGEKVRVKPDDFVTSGT
jgi:hypothetical protein